MYISLPTPKKSKAPVVLAFIGIVAIVAAIAYFSFRPTETSLNTPSDMITPEEKDFMRWMYDHRKTYTTYAEFNYRFNVWKTNNYKISQHNARNDATHSMAMNKFGDLDTKEFKKLYTGYKSNANAATTVHLDTSNL